MKKKIEIKNIFGNVLFTHECEDNSVKITVEEAVRQDVSLCMANLHGADLHGADLYCADLRGADLYCADLRGANLRGADLRDANLHGANLRGADLRGADLYYANLHGANLHGADLRGADLHGAKNIPFIPIACPSDGSFIGWKKIKGCLVKLLIPEDAKRSSATTNKCRCDKAKVLEIIDLTTNEHLDDIINEEYAKCVYRVGEMVYPDKFDKERWKECSHGIHFFINKQEAVEYVS